MRVQYQFASAAWRDSLRQTESAQTAKVEEIRPILDSRRDSRGTCRKVRTAAAGARVPAVFKVQVDLRRRHSQTDRRKHRSTAHLIQPGGSGYRQVIEQQSKPAKHSGPSRPRK